jgi:fructose-bisphosphate aldolase class II
MVMTATIRQVFTHTPGEFDPRKYLGPARAALVEMYKRKNRDVLGSAARYGQEL